MPMVARNHGRNDYCKVMGVGPNAGADFEVGDVVVTMWRAGSSIDGTPGGRERIISADDVLAVVEE